MSNKLQLTHKALMETKDLQSMFDMDAVRHNAVQNLIKTTGKNEEAALMHYEREKILFFKALSANKKIEQCDKFSVYSAWIELMVSGSTLNEGNSFLIPYGKKLQFQMGWRGRLEQLIQIPSIVNIPPPQVVYENDDFDYELGEKPRIIKHKPVKENRGDLFAVYLIIEKTNGYETHLMLAPEVLNIRDRYSKPYRQYLEECKAHKKEIGETFTKNMGTWDLTIEPPMWITSPEEAWKKTIILRAYKWQPKTARMKALDEQIKNNFDPELGTGGEETTHDIDYGLANESEQATDATATTTTAATPAAKTAATPKKKPEPVKANPPPATPAPTETVDEETGEVNPVDDLPDLNNLGELNKSF